MAAIEMRSQDLVELWQLFTMWQRTYGSAPTPEVVAAKYAARTGRDISKETNPRGSGRKPRYDAHSDQQITALRAAGCSIRQIAREMSCSIGHVQDVLNRGVC